MVFTETGIKGAFLVDSEPRRDHRGYLARTFSALDFRDHGLLSIFVQAYISHTEKRGTIRGLHYQVPPASEAKLVRCIQGAIFDVIVDLRPGSPTFLKHIGVELTAESGRALYVPEMCGHGCQTLRDGTRLMSQSTAHYAPECERGIRYDDPVLELDWPLPISAVSAKDAAWAPLPTRALAEAP